MAERTFTTYVNGIEVSYSINAVNGRPALTELRVRGGDITSDHLRAIKPARLIAGAHAGSERPRLCRPDGYDPEGFYRAVAIAFRSASAESPRPCVVLAEENAVPADTVRFWVKEARRRGLLEPARVRRKR